ncbi:hypothetical protein [Streptomyces marispadix]|uniref:Uncharacterized protein n=1 Tax=Streptomyces marispadix TaxID=2922868 RepID=A0ABS9T0G0_9ACTN|nr:hypothetical protein [Streptomyces marispadix]MCH6162019.1 hypothetical protein [Streptomyces marispadix]
MTANTTQEEAMASKPELECITKTTNKAGADVIVTKDHTALFVLQYQAYCHGCTDSSKGFESVGQATSWAQNHANICNFS